MSVATPPVTLRLSMFTTLLGALPRPPLPVDAPRDALIEAAIRAQEAAGLDPVTDGGPPADRDLARAWSATQRLTDHAVKQAVAGPYTAGLDGTPPALAAARRSNWRPPSTRSCATWPPRAAR